MTATKVINIWPDNPDFSQLASRNPDLQKIVVGESPTSQTAKITDVPSLPLLQTEFRNLTHLYLWNTRRLPLLPTLPDNQQVLEIRGSTDLSRIDNLPTSLQSIVMDDCPQLCELPELTGSHYSQLKELILANCPNVSEGWVLQLIDAAPNLDYLDLSGCPQISRLPARLPGSLRRLELNRCQGLKELPDPLPQSLVRLGLREANELIDVPDLPRSINYVDLSFTYMLRKLPRFPQAVRSASDAPKSGKPRTLFLFGSGILEPPSSEHGDAADKNVAVDTREYLDEVQLVGRGTVKRCKLLLLGNGKAGKTKLALNLNPHFDKRERKFDKDGNNIGGDYVGSTHGVQFWDWPDYEAATDTKKMPVNLHMWDFGGQEIYHSTHRLFVSRGSIFVVMWNPEQDNQQPKPEAGVQDVWHPVRYWLDFIQAECPHNRPLVAIVCSHQGSQWRPNDEIANQSLVRELKNRLRGSIGDEYTDRYPLFVFDSENDLGQRELLEEWISTSVGKVVEAQGTMVPTYWEIGQNMVEKWLRGQRRVQEEAKRVELADWHAQHSRMSLADFTDRFRNAIEQALEADDEFTDLDLLRDCWDPEIFLTERRVQRTLRFLTNSGWLYWTDQLFDSRVIINQSWALDKVYACLERREKTTVYANLVKHGGRFTFDQLRDWCRDELGDLDDDDQQLIMTFMESVGVCFRVTQRWHSERNETVYISPTHLPPSNEIANTFDLQHLDQFQDVVPSEQLHRGHWFKILSGVCRIYGDEATYTRDACLIRSARTHWDREDRNWTALLRFYLDDVDKDGNEKVPGLGGRVSIGITGSQAQEGLAKLREFVESFLPGYKGNPSAAVSGLEQQLRSCDEKAKTVFFSYAWDPVDKVGYYEEAVDAIEAALMPFGQDGSGKLNILRDKSSMEPGDYITEFINKAGAPDIDLVLLFTSDKYWKSWWCMIEFSYFLLSLIRDENKAVNKSVLVIEHESGKKYSSNKAAELIKHWNSMTESQDIGFDKVPDEFPEQLYSQSWRKLRADFVHIITTDSVPITSNASKLRKEWRSEDADEIIAWVKQKLELPTERQ